MSQIILVTEIQSAQPAITIEQAAQRKIQRRRRVAKRLVKRFPLFAVEIMQKEFPGYTYDEFVADVTRKTRKSKSFRRPKTKAFDWATIRKEIPEFFNACKQRHKTKAVLHCKIKSGHSFTVVVRSYWLGDYGEGRFRTHELIRLWRDNNLKAFCSHPAMQLFEHHNEIAT